VLILDSVGGDRVLDPLHVVRGAGVDIRKALQGTTGAKGSDPHQDPGSVAAQAALQWSTRVAYAGAALAVQLAGAQVTAMDVYKAAVGVLAPEKS